MLDTFDETDTRSNQADWLELSLILSPETELSSSAMVRLLGLIEESPEFGSEYDPESDENLDEEILESRVDQLVQDIWAELSYRSETLLDAYPFQLVPVGQSFVLSKKAAVGGDQVNAHRVYAACLLITAARRSMIQRQAEGDELDALVRTSARVLQILAVKSSAHFVAGDAYWFGWPRIDEATSYTDALRRLVTLLGHGKLKIARPEWSDAAEKDGTVDVVAWHSFPDHTYGSLVMYGQVASGLNWRSKPIHSFIEGYFHDWFEDNPSWHWLPAMFIPFNLHAEARRKNGYDIVQVAVGTARREERTYGIVFDRMRMAALNLVDETAHCEPEGEHMRQHDSLVREVDEWLESVTAYASRSS